MGDCSYYYYTSWFAD